MERIQSRVKTLLHGSAKVQTESSEPTATNADTMWRLGMMGALGIFVHNKNIDKGNRR
jgi:hypothetical protein